MSVNLILFFKKSLTSSSLAETITVSNNELFSGKIDKIFVNGNFLISIFFKLKSLSLDISILLVFIFF